MKLDHRQLAFLLYEWKIVHTHVQDIFLQVCYVEPLIHINFLNEETLKILIDSWYNMCERKLKKIVKELKELKQVKDRCIDDIFNLFSDKSIVLDRLYDIEIGNAVTHRNAHIAVNSLKETLDEALRVADLNICEIADIFKGET